jgi:hypothetical protein
MTRYCVNTQLPAAETDQIQGKHGPTLSVAYRSLRLAGFGNRVVGQTLFFMFGLSVLVPTEAVSLVAH